MLRPLVSLIGTLALGGCTVLGIRAGTEQPSYTVVAQLARDVEVRRYESRLAAETRVAAADERGARGEAFGILAGYIFGRSRSGEEVAMTAPVATAGAPEGLTMRFFMPSAYSRANLPDPLDPRVRIVEVPGETLAVLRFTGGIDTTAVERRRAELLKVVEASGWRVTGEPVSFFYDPPWTVPFLRRNEVAVPVAPPSGAQSTSNT